jgi:hypothetical protein
MGPHENQVPGVTFHFSRATHTGMADGTLHLHLELEATINDEPLWEEVRQKFIEGIRIYKGENFHAAIIDAVRADLTDTRHENEQLERELRKEKNARMLVEEELAKYKETISRFGSALRSG